jgi:hypothetical protein
VTLRMAAAFYRRELLVQHATCIPEPFCANIGAVRRTGTHYPMEGVHDGDVTPLASAPRKIQKFVLFFA